MMVRVFFACLLLAAPASALEPMTGEEFRAFTDGYTLYVEDETGAHFGADQFPGDNRSIWLPSEGDCLHGVWAQVDDRICFLYEDGRPACWLIYRDGETSLRFESAPALEEEDYGATDALPPLFLTKRDKRPLICPEGPGV